MRRRRRRRKRTKATVRRRRRRLGVDDDAASDPAPRDVLPRNIAARQARSPLPREDTQTATDDATDYKHAAELCIELDDTLSGNLPFCSTPDRPSEYQKLSGSFNRVGPIDRYVFETPRT